MSGACWRLDSCPRLSPRGWRQMAAQPHRVSRYLTRIGLGALQAIPDWIVDIIGTRRTRHQRDGQSSRWTNPGGSIPARGRLCSGHSRPRWRLILPSQCRASATVVERAAFRMGRMIAPGWIDHGDVADSLWYACLRNRLIADDGPDAVQATLASGVAAGLRESAPRSSRASRLPAECASGPQGAPSPFSSNR